jgi:hypothetical protein
MNNLSLKFAWAVKKCKIELADPLEIIKVNINMTKARSPNHNFNNNTRGKIADIERAINIEL